MVVMAAVVGATELVVAVAVVHSHCRRCCRYHRLSLNDASCASARHSVRPHAIPAMWSESGQACHPTVSLAMKHDATCAERVAYEGTARLGGRDCPDAGGHAPGTGPLPRDFLFHRGSNDPVMVDSLIEDQS